MPAFGIAPRLDPTAAIAARAARMGIQAPTGLMLDRTANYQRLADLVMSQINPGGGQALGRSIGGGVLDVTGLRGPVQYAKERLGYEFGRIGIHGPVGPSYTQLAPASPGESMVANRLGMSVDQYRTWKDRAANVEMGAQAGLQTTANLAGVGGMASVAPRLTVAGLGAMGLSGLSRQVLPNSNIEMEAKAAADADADTIKRMQDMPMSGARNGFTAEQRARWVSIAQRRGFKLEDIRQMSDWQLYQAGIKGQTGWDDMLLNIPGSLIGALASSPQGVALGVEAAVDSAQQGSLRPIGRFARDAFLAPPADLIRERGDYVKRDPVGAFLMAYLGARGGAKVGAAATRRAVTPFAGETGRLASVRDAVTKPEYGAARIVEREKPLTSVLREGEEVGKSPPVYLGAVPDDPIKRVVQYGTARYMGSNWPGARGLYQRTAEHQAKLLGSSAANVGNLKARIGHGDFARELRHLSPDRQQALSILIQNEPDAVRPQTVQDAADFHANRAAELGQDAQLKLAELEATKADMLANGDHIREVDAATQGLKAQVARLEEDSRNNAMQAGILNRAAASVDPARGGKPFAPEEIAHYRDLVRRGNSATEQALIEGGMDPGAIKARYSLETRTRDPGMRAIERETWDREKHLRKKDRRRASSLNRQIKERYEAARARAELEHRRNNMLAANRWRREADNLSEQLIGEEGRRIANERAAGIVSDPDLVREAGLSLGPKVEHHLVGQDVAEAGGRFGARNAARDRAYLGRYVLMEDGRVGKVVDGERAGVGIIAVEGADGKVEYVRRHFRGKAEGKGKPSIARMAERLRTTTGSRKGVETFPRDTQGKRIPQQKARVAGGEEATVWEVAPNVVIYKAEDTSWTPPNTLVKAPQTYVAPRRWTIGVKANGDVFPLHEVTDSDFAGFDSPGKAAEFVRGELPAGVNLADPGTPAMLNETAQAFDQRYRENGGDLFESLDDELAGNGNGNGNGNGRPPVEGRNPILAAAARRQMEELYGKADRAQREPFTFDYTPDEKVKALIEERDKLRAEDRPAFERRVRQQVIDAQMESMVVRGIDPVLYTPHRRITPDGDVYQLGSLGTGKPHMDFQAATGSGRFRYNQRKLLLAGAVDPSVEVTLREATRPIKARWYINAVKVLAENHGIALKSLDEMTPQMERTHVILDLNHLNGLVTRHGIQGKLSQILDEMSEGHGVDNAQLNKVIGIREKVDPDIGIIDQPGNYVAIPRKTVKKFQDGFRHSSLPDGMNFLGQLTDLFRYTQLNMRPGYHANNAATMGIMAAQSGALFNPRAWKNSLRTEELGGPGGNKPRYPAEINQTISGAMGANTVREMPGDPRGGLHRVARKPGTLEQRLPFKVAGRGVEAMALAANRFEQLMQKLIYHQATQKDFARKVDAEGIAKTQAHYEQFLEDIADGESFQPRNLQWLFDNAGKFSARRNETLAFFIPFYRWYSSMIRMTFWSLPAKHPGRAYILHSLAQYGDKIADENGQSLYDDLRNAIRLGIGDWYFDLTAVSPYAVANQLAGERFNPIQTFAQGANPMITAALEIPMGFSLKDWRNMTNAEGEKFGVIGDLRAGEKRSDSMLLDRALTAAGRAIRTWTPWSYQLQPQNEKGDNYVPYADLLPGVDQGQRTYKTPDSLRRRSGLRLDVPGLGGVNAAGLFGLGLRNAPLEGPGYQAAFQGEVGAAAPEPGMTAGAINSAKQQGRKLRIEHENYEERRQRLIRELRAEYQRGLEKGEELIPYDAYYEPLTWDELEKLSVAHLREVTLDYAE